MASSGHLRKSSQAFTTTQRILQTTRLQTKDSSDKTITHYRIYHATTHYTCITHYLLLVGEPASDRLLTDDSESLLDRRLDGDSGCDPRF